MQRYVTKRQAVPRTIRSKDSYHFRIHDLQTQRSQHGQPTMTTCAAFETVSLLRQYPILTAQRMRVPNASTAPVKPTCRPRRFHNFQDICHNLSAFNFL